METTKTTFKNNIILREIDKEKIRDDFFAKGRLAAEDALKAVAERANAKKDGLM